jgi:hypothetical protein
MGKRRTPALPAPPFPEKGDLVILPASDPLISSLRPSGVGIVIGPMDLTGLPKWRHKTAKECIEVLFPEGVRTFDRSRLKVISDRLERV